MRKTFKFGVADVTAAGTVISSGHAIAGLDQFPTSPGLLEAASSSADDALAGIGTESIRAWGLRGELGSTEFVQEDLTMSGLSLVSGSPDWIRVFRARSRTGNTNLGNIDLSIGGNAACRIPANIGSSETAIYSLPDNRFARIRRIHARMLKSSGASPSAIIKFWVKEFSGPWRVQLSPLAVTPEVGIQSHELHGGGFRMIPGCDMKMEIFEFSGTSATVVAGFDLDLFDLSSDA